MSKSVNSLELTTLGFSLDSFMVDGALPTGAVYYAVKSDLAGLRAGTACTKNKALVSGGGKKPFKQKGTGRARQGSNRSPLMPGGGTAHGPKPRDFSEKLNKKVRQKAIKDLLLSRFAEKVVFEIPALDFKGKTKNAASFLATSNLAAYSHTVICTKSEDQDISRALRNLPNCTYVSVDNLGIKALARSSAIVFVDCKEEVKSFLQ